MSKKVRDILERKIVKGYYEKRLDKEYKDDSNQL